MGWLTCGQGQPWPSVLAPVRLHGLAHVADPAAGVSQWWMRFGQSLALGLKTGLHCSDLGTIDGHLAHALLDCGQHRRRIAGVSMNSPSDAPASLIWRPWINLPDRFWYHPSHACRQATCRLTDCNRRVTVVCCVKAVSNVATVFVNLFIAVGKAQQNYSFAKAFISRWRDLNLMRSITSISPGISEVLISNWFKYSFNDPLKREYWSSYPHFL